MHQYYQHITEEDRTIFITQIPTMSSHDFAVFLSTIIIIYIYQLGTGRYTQKAEPVGSNHMCYLG